MGLQFHPAASAQQLADIIPHGIAILGRKFDLVSENNRFRMLIPFSEATFHDRWLQSMHQDDVARANASLNRFAISKSTLRLEYRIRDQDIWCVLTLNFLPANGPNFGLNDDDGFIVTVADITPEKRAEISQIHRVKDAEEHKHLQERFIDMISHEIRNPLTAILHCTEDIMEAAHEKEHKEVSSSRIRQSAETISLCISHQKKILDDVLTFSKIDASMLTLSPRKCQPKSYFKDPMSFFRPQLQRNNIQFGYQCDKSYADCGIEWVIADLDRISQVLINLLSNAIKFTAKSKNTRRIRVSIGASQERPSSYPPNVVFFKSNENALGLDKTASPEWGDGEYAYIMLAIRDTGIGINDHAQMRLFERFYQATPKTEGIYGGSGLGLNVSRKLCHLHGGEIGVSSKEGQGSTFGFFFRVRKTVRHWGDSIDGAKNISEVDKLSHNIQALGVQSSETEGLTPDVQIPHDPPENQIDELSRSIPPDERTEHTRDIARKAIAGIYETDPGQTFIRKILIVEDNSINRTILTRKLRSSGFEVNEARNGLETLNYFQNNRPDCILMDQEMPLMDGNAATRRIRELEKGSALHIPILGVTANARSEQKSEMLEAGMDDVVHKPFHTEEIVSKISQFGLTRLETTKI
jgi:signal transduction histidine kinase/ActR/RegA family two-component response regulator